MARLGCPAGFVLDVAGRSGRVLRRLAEIDMLVGRISAVSADGIFVLPLRPELPRRSNRRRTVYHRQRVMLLDQRKGCARW